MPDTQPASLPGPSLVDVALIALIALFLVVSLAGLSDYPMPFCDESILSSVSYSFVDRGRFGIDYIAGLSGLAENFVHGGRLFHAVQGATFLVFGSSLFVARLFSWAGMLAATAFVVLTGQKLFSTRTGLLAGLLFVANINVFFISHIARGEAWLTAAFIGVFFYYLVVRDAPTLLRHAFLGVFAAFTIEIHPVGVWIAITIGIMLIIARFRSAEGRWWILAFGAGGALASLAILALHLLPDPALAIALVSPGGLIAEHDALWGGSLVGRVVAQFDYMVRHYVTGFNGVPAVFTVYGLAGIGYGLVRRNDGQLPVLAALGISLLLFTLGQEHKGMFYRILWDPFVALLIGAAVVDLGERLPRLDRHAWALLLVGPLLAINFAAEAWLTVKFLPRDYRAYTTQVAERVPPDVTVIGEPILWYGLHERNAFVGDSVFYQYMLVNGVDTMDRVEIRRLLADLRIDYAIADGSLACFDPDALAQRYNAVLDESCMATGTFQNPWFGVNGINGAGEPITVYDCTSGELSGFED